MANESRHRSQRVSAALSQIYAERRGRAEQAALQRAAAVHSRYPQLAELERAVAKAGADLLIASRGDADTEEVWASREAARDRLHTAEQERLAWLKAFNIPKEYSVPDWTCKTCADSGYVRLQPCPDCYRATLIPLLFEANTVSGLSEGSFEAFDLSLFRDEPLEHEDPERTPRKVMDQIRKAVLRWSDTFDETKNDLLFVGATGTGKTYLASAIARRLIDEGYSVAFLSSPTFFDVIGQFQTMKQMFNPDPAEYAEAKERYEALFDAELLILDDLGSEYQSSRKAGAELLTILDRRHQSGRRTIVVTNLDVPELQASFDERLTSRLLGRSIPIRFPGGELGDDVRLRRQKR